MKPGEALQKKRKKIKKPAPFAVRNRHDLLVF